jgi:alpha-D-ribose 1-methylphosphonate 5-triphosphate synthase subunit PhnG
MTEPLQSAQDAKRRDWLAVLSRAQIGELERCAERVGPLPPAQTVRAAETGMLMLRGRIGGTGAAFNLGEASVTRCAMRVGGGPLGIGYTLGRDRRKAELVALFDALLQDDARGPWCMEQVIEPLRKRQAQQRDAANRAAATSRVDFLTMVRGEA